MRNLLNPSTKTFRHKREARPRFQWISWTLQLLRLQGSVFLMGGLRIVTPHPLLRISVHTWIHAVPDADLCRVGAVGHKPIGTCGLPCSLRELRVLRGKEGGRGDGGHGWY